MLLEELITLSLKLGSMVLSHPLEVHVARGLGRGCNCSNPSFFALTSYVNCREATPGSMGAGISSGRYR